MSWSDFFNSFGTIDGPLGFIGRTARDWFNDNIEGKGIKDILGIGDTSVIEEQARQSLPVIGPLYKSAQEQKFYDDYAARYPAVNARGGIRYPYRYITGNIPYLATSNAVNKFMRFYRW